MEPEWNNSPEYDDATLLGLRDTPVSKPSKDTLLLFISRLFAWWIR